MQDLTATVTYDQKTSCTLTASPDRAAHLPRGAAALLPLCCLPLRDAALLLLFAHNGGAGRWPPPCAASTAGAGGQRHAADLSAAVPRSNLICTSAMIWEFHMRPVAAWLRAATGNSGAADRPR